MLVPLLGFFVFLALAAAAVSMLDVASARKRMLRRRLEGRRSEEAGEEHTRASGTVLGALSRIGRAFSPRGPSQTLEDQLAQAGYYGKSASSIYVGAKMILFVVGLGVSALCVHSMERPMHTKALIAMSAGTVAFFLPNLFVAHRRRKRYRQVWTSMPDAVDLLEICVTSGMGLDMAWNVVAEEIRGLGPSLAEEMQMTNLEIHLGASRLAATKHMADRTGVEEISSFASMLAQSERFGTSIADALQTFATSMREERSIKAQEDAEETAVKLIFPMAIFIFPAMLIVLVGPAVLKAIKYMGGGM